MLSMLSCAAAAAAAGAPLEGTFLYLALVKETPGLRRDTATENYAHRAAARMYHIVRSGFYELVWHLSLGRNHCFLTFLDAIAQGFEMNRRCLAVGSVVILADTSVSHLVSPVSITLRRAI
jgi:hypothetical protein